MISWNQDQSQEDVTWRRDLKISLIQNFLLRQQGHEARGVVSARDETTHGKDVFLDALGQQGREETWAACSARHETY